MDLTRFFPSFGKSEKKDHHLESFLAVKISKSSIYAVSWYVENGHVKIGPVGEDKINENSFEGFLKASDNAISIALAEAPNASKVVFAISPEYISDGKIEPEELHRLRRLCKELDLEPLGYVNPSEAILEYFKEKEGAPLSAILVGIDGNKIALSVFKAGKEAGAVIFEKEAGAQLSTAGEIEKGLKRFGHLEALPSRILIYDGGMDLADLANEITAYPWTGRLPFLHFPKVEQLTSEFVVMAVAFTGGMQMGGKMVPMAIDKAPEAELVEVSPEEAGFFASSNEVEITPMPEQVNHTPNPIRATENEKPRKQLKFPKMPSFKIGNKGTKIVALALIAIVILFVGLTGTVFFIPKAEIVAHVDSQEFDREMNVGVTTNGDESGESLKGEFLQTTEIGTNKSVVTGQKLVGKKARGNVTIYSVTDGRSFPSETLITSPSGLKFTLTKDVSVASGDAATSATVTVPVEASAIGDSFNLGAGTKFSVGNLSSSLYLAKNESAFSGGESHMAKVVTKEDQDRLMASLSGELSEKALASLQAKVEKDQKLLPNAITSSILKKKYSKDIDSEAEYLNLDLSMDFKGVVFSENEALELFRNKYGSEIAKGYEMQDATISVTQAEMDKNKETNLVLRLSSRIAPRINLESITGQVAGKSQNDASEILKKIPGVKKVQFAVKPAFFAPLSKYILPINKENIKLVVINN